MKIQDTGLSMKWSLFGFLVLVCVFPLAAADFPETIANVTDHIKKSPQKYCYVCNSMVEDCNNATETMNRTCVDPTGYLQTVYGQDVFKITGSGNISEWPASLTEIANEATPNPTYQMGWGFGAFPDSYISPAESPTPASVNFSSIQSQYKGGFKSCRKIKIYTTTNNNAGKVQEIPEDYPKIIRTCSFVDPKDVNDYTNGCKKIIMKTATVEVCYCKGNLCNQSSRIRIASSWILATCVLVLAANFGLNMHS